MSKEKKFYVLKLGGSLITDKNHPFSLRKQVIKDSIQQIIKSNTDLILIHGGGSFGHPVGKQYKIIEGKNDNIENQIYGLAKTHDAMNTLNTYIIHEFLDQKQPVLSVQTSSIFFMDESRNLSFNSEVIRYCLDLNIIPILYGDIIFTQNKNFSIISGDDIILKLCETFGRSRISKIVFAMEIDGIFIEDVNTGEPKLAQHLKPNQLDNIKLAKLGKKIDITGGIDKKLDVIKTLTKFNVPIQLINGLKDRNIYNSLQNKDFPCTNIKGSS